MSLNNLIESLENLITNAENNGSLPSKTLEELQARAKDFRRYSRDLDSNPYNNPAASNPNYPVIEKQEIETFLKKIEGLVNKNMQVLEGASKSAKLSDKQKTQADAMLGILNKMTEVTTALGKEAGVAVVFKEFKVTIPSPLVITKSPVAELPKNIKSPLAQALKENKNTQPMSPLNLGKRAATPSAAKSADQKVQPVVTSQSAQSIATPQSVRSEQARSVDSDQAQSIQNSPSAPSASAHAKAKQHFSFSSTKTAEKPQTETKNQPIPFKKK